MKWKKTGNSALFYLGCLLLLVVMLFPFYWLLNSSLKTSEELVAFPPTYWPHSITLDNYLSVFVKAPFMRYFANSLIIASGTVGITMLFCAPASYAICRYKNKWTTLIAMAFLVFSMFPGTAFAIPIYKTLKSIGLLNTNAGLIITYLTFAIPSTIWLLNVYFATVPRALEEAAMIDGSTRIGLLWRIVLPIAAPGLASAAILAFIRCWNEFFYAYVLITDRLRKTIPVGINDYKQEYAANWEILAAASIVAVVPVLIMILLFQKRIESGLAAGAVKA